MCFERRRVRFGLVAGCLLALAVPAQLAAAEGQRSATQTTLAAQIRDQAGHTQVKLEVAVASEDGSPARGAIVIEDGARELAGMALDVEGKAKLSVDLAEGDHALRAVYKGDAAHVDSSSEIARIHAQASTTPDFSISVSPATLSLPLGESGSVVAAIKPINNTLLTAPMFVTLSCQGLPDESSCTFTPENIEILQNSCTGSSGCPIKSTMVVQTQLGTGQSSVKRASTVSWAIILPGTLALIGLGWRRRGGWGGFALLGSIALVCSLGMSACNPRYNYFNHGPPHNPSTPAGTYTLTVTAQSNNGVAAINHTATMALTVQ